MNNIPEELKVEIAEYIIDLQKGLIEDPNWDFDLDNCDWETYQEAFLNPSVLRTTISIWLNHLKLNGKEVENWEYARHRSYQYFRNYFDKDYTPEKPFEAWEIEEPH